MITHDLNGDASPVLTAREQPNRAAAELVRNLAHGALAGGLATIAMTAVMETSRRLGFLGRYPPKKITISLLDTLSGRRVEAASDHTAIDVLTGGLHAAFGMSMGALYAATRRGVTSRPMSPMASSAVGAAFGSAVWALSYAGWVPALGIMAKPSRDRPGRPATMLLAHWVYGAALGAMIEKASIFAPHEAARAR